MNRSQNFRDGETWQVESTVVKQIGWLVKVGQLVAFPILDLKNKNSEEH